MKKILTILGARPQFIKAAAVSRALRESGRAEEIIVHTGQHYDHQMSDVFFEELEIPKPKHHLGIGSGPHGQQTGRMLEAIEKVMLEERPDIVMVYGDTNSTLAGAVAAAKLHILVAHVEAGLRSFNKRMPEEINRILTDHVSEWLLAPTENAVKLLKNEGVATDKTHLVGDVMFDASMFFSRKAESSSKILETLGLSPKGYVLSTIHRAENTDDPARFELILRALANLARRIPVVLPLHPRSRVTAEKHPVAKKCLEALRVIEPVGYLDMIRLEQNAKMIATDSGGVQKEAFFFQVPCVTLRDETEWVELVDLGWNKLAPPTDGAAVLSALEEGLERKGKPGQPYGDGLAARKITELLTR